MRVGGVWSRNVRAIVRSDLLLTPAHPDGFGLKLAVAVEVFVGEAFAGEAT